jgi:hypothetical protein
VADLWRRLGSYFGIPVSKTGEHVTADSSKWSFFARFKISPIQLGAQAGGEHTVEVGEGSTHDVHADEAVPAAVAALIKSGQRVTIVIDDFHFVAPSVALGIVQAMKSVAHAGASIVLITLPHRAAQIPAMVEDVKGRTVAIAVPQWTEEELARIAIEGFPKLNLIDEGDRFATRLARESYGSPQLMQQLCLDFCERVNGVLWRATVPAVLHAPENWQTFHRYINDKGSLDWLKKLEKGPKTRGEPRGKHLLKDGRNLDPYAIIICAMQALSPQTEIPFITLQEKTAHLLKDPSTAGRLVIGPKLVHMSKIASAHLDAELAEDLQDGSLVIEDVEDEKVNYQPVFEYRAETAHILEPFLAYVLKWHH